MCISSHKKIFPFPSCVLFLLSLILLHSNATLQAQDLTYEAMVLVPKEINAGGRSSVTITTIVGAEKSPANLQVTLFLVKDSDRTFLGSTNTGDFGHITIPFDVPAVIGSGVYQIEATIEGLSEPLVSDTTVSKAPAILIETDKPIYKPAQKIQGRVVLLDNALRPSTGEVELSIQDAKGIRIVRKTLTTNEYGIAPFELQLASEVNFGVWKVKVSSDGVQSTRDVRVENYVLPRYELGASFDKNWVLVDEAIQGTVEARYFFGKPVAGTVQIIAKRFIGDWEEYAQTAGSFTEGKFEFQLPAVGFVAGTLGNNGLGTVTLEITATDTTGHTQSTTEVLTISQSPVVIRLISRSESLKSEIPADILITTERPDGTPVDETIEITATFLDFGGGVAGSETRDVTTSGGGANVTFIPPADISRATFYASAQIEGHLSESTLEVSASYSPSSSYLAVSRTGSQGTVQIGEELTLTAISTHPGSVFFDVYAGGRTVFSGVSDDRQIRFFATAEMAPAAKVVAYIINPDNEISADTLPFDVDLPMTISVESQISKEDLRPGDEITLTIDTGQRAMVGLAIVDNSVLALGRSRLHLGEVFAELERRFMEPQGVVHGNNEGGNPKGDIFFGPGFGPQQSPGAFEILEDVGLNLVTTPGIQVPQGEFFGWDVLEDADGPLAVPGVRFRNEATTGTGEVVRVRQFFPETWIWNPTLLTDENGHSTLNLTVPDSITSWSISTMVSSTEGIGFGQGEAVVFQDFFVEPDIPIAVTRGEEFPVRVQIFNYLEQSQTVDLQFGAGDWFDLLGDADLSVNVPAGSAISASFPIRPTLVGEHQVQVLASGSVLSDAVIRKIVVEAEGEPVELVRNSVIQAGETVSLDTSLPSYAVVDSGKAFLHITPSPIAQTLTGISGLLGMPFGCGEQNMIFLAPDVEVLRYIRSTGVDMPEVRAEAEHFINVGYQRQLTFQTDDGGFAAFGGADGSLWLTAFVLSTFSIARDVRDIDETMLARAADMLISRQNEDGSFRTDDFLIHKEMDGGLGNLYGMTAYVANALADYQTTNAVGGTTEETALQKAAQYLANERSMVHDDAYVLSIAAVALGKVSGFSETTNEIIDRLLELAIHEGIGIHWEPYPIETTGYATLALLAQDRPEAASAVEWISTQRNSLGGFGQSTQDTVVAIRALTEAALKIRTDLDVTLTVKDGETQMAALVINDSNYDILQTVELPVDRAEGLSLSSVGSGNVGFQVARKFHIPAEHLPPPHDMTIEVFYYTEGVTVDDVVDVIVKIAYVGSKEQTGMALVDISIPTGFQAMGASLDALVNEGIASRVDIAGRKVIIYIDSLISETLVEFKFQVKALYPVRADAPISKIYEYYDSDIQASTLGDPITILSGENFVRGDANDDKIINISDVSRILGFLFLGGDLSCKDQGDVNDDGRLNIADAIAILNYLFFDGFAPKPPYPEPGKDPTADALGENCGE